MLPLAYAMLGSSAMSGIGGFMQSQNQMDFDEAMWKKNAEFQRDMAREQMAFQKEQASTAMAFDERMANTAHVREVADLKLAGLNPILSANGGAATPTAPAPSGAMPSTSAPTVGSLPNYLASAVSSAMDMLRLNTDMKEANSRIGKNQAESVAALKRADLNDSERHALEQRIFQTQRRLDVERRFPGIWGFIDALNDRALLVNSAASLGRSIIDKSMPASGAGGDWTIPNFAK